VVIIGAGSAAGVVYDILASSPTQIPIGMVGKPADIPLPPIPVLFESDEAFLGWDRHAYDSVIIAVGFPHLNLRKKLFELYDRHGIPITTAIHPSSYIANMVKIGRGTVISPYTSIGFASTIGENCWIASGVIIEHHNTIGNHTHISPGVKTAGLVKIGDDAMLGSGVIVVNNITIGNRVKVASGKVVVRDIKDGEIVK